MSQATDKTREYLESGRWTPEQLIERLIGHLEEQEREIARLEKRLTDLTKATGHAIASSRVYK